MTARKPTYIALLIGLAALVSAVSAAYVVLSTMQGETHGYPGGFPHAFIMQAPRFFLWLALLPLIRRASRAIPIDLSEPQRWLPAQVLIALALVLLHFGVRSVFMASIGHGYSPQGVQPFLDHFAKASLRGLPITAAEYLIILAIFVGSDWVRRHRERELVTSQLAVQLSEAKLHALRMQLNPHFLFNTMNSIASLVRTSSNAEAVTMIAGLSDLLRYVLAHDAPVEVPLAEELAVLDRYLAIEKARFGDRIKVIMDVEPAALGALVPSLMLQPLAENSIRHGLSTRVKGGEIRIAAGQIGEQLIIEVQDNGAGLTTPLAVDGVGLSNTRKRLATLYGLAQSFDLFNAPAGGAIARITLPYHMSEPAAAYSS